MTEQTGRGDLARKNASAAGNTQRVAATEAEPEGKQIFTTGDVAKMLQVAPRTISKWFDSGRLRGFRIPGSQDRRIPRQALEKFIEEHGFQTLPEIEHRLGKTPKPAPPAPKEEAAPEAEKAPLVATAPKVDKSTLKGNIVQLESIDKGKLVSQDGLRQMQVYGKTADGDFVRAHIRESHHDSGRYEVSTYKLNPSNQTQEQTHSTIPLALADAKKVAGHLLRGEYPGPINGKFTADTSTVNVKPMATAALSSELHEAAEKHRSGFVSLAREQGWYTDGKILFRMPDKEWKKLKLPNAAGRAPDIEATLKAAIRDTDTTGANIVGVRYSPDTGIPEYHLRSNTGRETVVNAILYQTVASRFPKATVRLNKAPDRPLTFEQDGKTVALIMPLSYNRKDKLKYEG